MVWVKRQLLWSLLLVIGLSTFFNLLINAPATAAAIPFGCPGSTGVGPMVPTANYPCPPPEGGAIINGFYYAADTGRLMGGVGFKVGDETGTCQNTLVLIKRVSGPAVGPSSFTIPAAGGFSEAGIGTGKIKLVVANCAGSNGKTYSGESGEITVTAGKITRADVTLTKEGSGDSVTCDAGAMSWLICSSITLVLTVVDYIFQDVLPPLLRTDDITNSDIARNAWAAIRNVTNVFLVLIFMFVIFGTAMGYDNYTAKKMLPKLAAAAVLIQFSWWIGVIIIDFFNVLGFGLQALMQPIIPKSGAGGFNVDGFGQNISTLAVIGGSVALLTGGAIGISLGTIISVLLVLLFVFAVLTLRKIIILMLLVGSSVAFLAWILPNTEKYFRMWYENLIKLGFVFVYIMMCFMMGRLFAGLAPAFSTSESQSFLVPLYQLAGYVLPLAAIGGSVAVAGAAGRAISNAASKARGAADNAAGQNSKFAKGMAERREMKAAAAATGRPVTFLGKKLQKDPNSVLAKMSRGAASVRGQGVAGSLTRRGKLANEAKADKYLTEHAQLEALKQSRQELGRQTADEAINARKTTMVDSERDKRISQESLKDFTVHKEDEAGNIISSTTTRLGDTALDGDGRKALAAKVSTDIQSGNVVGAIAAMEKLGQSQGGQDTLLRDVRKQVFGGTTSKLIDPKHAAVWSRATRNIKTDDAIKPPGSAYSDTSAEEVAGMSAARVGRQIDYYNDRKQELESHIGGLTSGSEEHIKATAELSTLNTEASKFGRAVEGALTSQQLKGKMQPDTVLALQQSMTRGDAFYDTSTRSAIQTRAAQIAPKSPPIVSAATSKEILSAAGNDVIKAEQIHSSLQANPVVRASIEQKILNGNQAEARTEMQTIISGAGAVSPYGGSIPPTVQKKIIEQYGNNADMLASTVRQYSNDPEYRQTVNNAALNSTSKKDTLPPPIAGVQGPMLPPGANGPIYGPPTPPPTGPTGPTGPSGPSGPAPQSTPSGGASSAPTPAPITISPQITVVPTSSGPSATSYTVAPMSGPLSAPTTPAPSSSSGPLSAPSGNRGDYGGRIVINPASPTPAPQPTSAPAPEFNVTINPANPSTPRPSATGYSVAPIHPSPNPPTPGTIIHPSYAKPTIIEEQDDIQDPRSIN